MIVSIVCSQSKNGRSDSNSTNVEEFFVEMRRLQSRNKCTDTTLYDIIETFSQYHDLDIPTRASLDKLDKKIQEWAGCSYLELHGCPQGKTIRPRVKACGRHVFQPTDRRRVCPLCGAPRYDNNGRPFEVGIIMFCLHSPYSFLLLYCMQRVFYFPITPKLRSLLNTQSYFELIQHEYERPKNSDFIADVYDTPAWRNFMGPATYPIERIGFQVCVDAIPAFAADTFSLKPFTWMNLSLSPAIRAKAPNMLLMMLLPATLKMGQKKYYDFAAKYELNRLFEEGVAGIKIKVFGCSMDTKGREELLGELSDLLLLPHSLSNNYLFHMNRHANVPGIPKLFGVYPLVESRPLGGAEKLYI